MNNSKKILVLFFGLSMLIACGPSRQIEKGIDLENTKWILVELGGKPLDQPDPAQPVSLTLLEATHGVQGFGGCNSFSGSYTHNSNTLQFTLISTKKFCRDKMDVEDYVFKTLIQVEYHIEGDLLIMKNEEGKSLTFRSTP